MTGSVKLSNESEWHQINYHFENDQTLQIDSPSDVIRQMSGATVHLILAGDKRMVGFASLQGRISGLEPVQMDFDGIVDEYIEALREFKTAHAEIMQCHNEDSKRRYKSATSRVEELGKGWHDAFQKAART